MMEFPAPRRPAALRHGRWVKGRTVGGRPYSYIKWTMPPIPQQYLDCVAFLYPTVEDARRGNTEGGATGFLVRTPLVELTPGESFDDDVFKALYLVTNRHCAKRTPVVRLNTAAGDIDIIEPKQEEWFYHPDGDDVAVLPLGLAREHFQFEAIQMAPRASWVAREDEVAHTQPGTEAFFAGRYVTLSGEQRNTPVLRFGAVALSPPTLIEHAHKPQESFLVEARSQAGFSGSPVFVYLLVTDLQFNRFPVPMNISLLGLAWGHLPRYQRIVEGDKTTPIGSDWWVRENSNMACVVPAWKITELLFETKELADMREAQAEEEQKAHHADLDEARQPTSGEFDR